jgi:hypothetical protein
MIIKLFDGEDVNLPKRTIIHHCHKIYDNCLERFKDEGRMCKVCPNLWDVEYKLHSKLVLNL